MLALLFAVLSRRYDFIFIVEEGGNLAGAYLSYATAYFVEVAGLDEELRSPGSFIHVFWDFMSRRDTMLHYGGYVLEISNSYA